MDVQEVRKLDAYLKKLFGNGRMRVVPKGAKTADLPIQRPTIFELVINVGTAKGHGLDVPSSLLLRADKIIH